MNDSSSSLRRGRTIVAMLTACIIGTLSIPSFAATVDEAQAKKTEAEQNLNDINQEISNIKAKQDDLQSQINELDTELIEVLVNIDVTESEIADKKEELEQDRKELELAEEAKDTQYEGMKERICYLYENGNISVLDSLLGENSFAQILNKVDNFEAMYSFDRGLLDEYIETCEEVETLINSVQQEKSELETLQSDLEKHQEELDNQKAEKGYELSSYDEQLTEAESLAKQYSATISEMEDVIAVEREAIIRSNAEANAKKAEKSASVSSSTQDDSVSCTCADDYEYVEESTTVYNGTGQEVANYACQFVGNPYVWGGTSLTNGCDCSGFIMSVYAHFGVSLPHSSSSLRSVGYGVDASNIQPGDIVCYSGHCAIYIGGGQIVHASNSQPYPAGGIKIGSDYTYRTVLAIRRIF